MHILIQDPHVCNRNPPNHGLFTPINETLLIEFAGCYPPNFSIDSMSTMHKLYDVISKIKIFKIDDKIIFTIL